jgi:hypothetical protein
MDTENPLESVERALAFATKDWSADRRDAWIYGIALGWDDESMAEMAARHNWNADAVSRLRQLHAAWQALKAKGVDVEA